MPTISDKLKIININKNFERNYRNNLLECIDIMYGLEPDKLQCMVVPRGDALGYVRRDPDEKYKKEIVDMAINWPKEGEEDEVVETDPKQNKEKDE